MNALTVGARAIELDKDGFLVELVTGLPTWPVPWRLPKTSS